MVRSSVAKSLSYPTLTVVLLTLLLRKMSRLQSSKSEYSGSVISDHSKMSADHARYGYWYGDYDINNGSCVDPVDSTKNNGDDSFDGGKTRSQADIAELINSTGLFQKVDDNYDPNAIRMFKKDLYNKMKNQKNGRRTSRSLNRKDQPDESQLADGQQITKSELMAEFIRTYGTPV